MSIQRIQPSKRFSEVVIHNNTAYFAGQVPEKTVKQCLRANLRSPITDRLIIGRNWF